jgi:hypothetical protein
MRTIDAIPDELDRALREAVSSAVGRYGGAVSAVRRDHDHDGDECIFVDIGYSLPDVPVDPEDVSQVVFRLNVVARDLGEQDFVYVHNHFDRNQRLDDLAVKRILRVLDQRVEPG